MSEYQIRCKQKNMVKFCLDSLRSFFFSPTYTFACLYVMTENDTCSECAYVVVLLWSIFCQKEIAYWWKSLSITAVKSCYDGLHGTVSNFKILMIIIFFSTQLYYSVTLWWYFVVLNVCSELIINFCTTQTIMHPSIY